MYEDIMSIQSDNGNMVSSIIAMIQKHVAEVWCQPRITTMAHKYNPVPGAAYDIETNDGTGNPWDFNVPEQRNKCVREILEQRPSFLIGSPVCTMFSILQGLNKARMDLNKWEASWNKGVCRMLFAIKSYRIQAIAGKFFPHEHPASASNWKLPETQALMEDYKLKKVNGQNCRFGVTGTDEIGLGVVKNPPGVPPMSAEQLDRKCMGGRQHVQLCSGQARACRV